MPIRPHRLHRSLAPLLAALAALALGAAASAAELECRTVPRLAREYLKGHVAQNTLTKELQQRAVDTYVLRIDPSRMLFLEAEATAARAALADVLESMDEGDCAPLQELHAQLVAAHAALEARVREIVMDPDFELDESVELQLDPEDRGYPKTAEERDELLRAMLHFQLSNYLSAGEEIDEAKRLLVHRYELRTRRAGELETEDVLSAFLDSFALSLDPHSNYFSADVLEDFKISMTLSLEGIGVALSERDGYSVVERIIPGGAADRLGEKGLRPKDKIIAVANEGEEPVNIIDMPLRDAVSLIRGKKGSTVKLTVLRQGEKTERFPLSIVRDTIDLAEQAAKLRFETREIDGREYKLAVIDLPSFYGDQDPSRRQCTDDLEKLLAEVKENEADGLLLDLSRNGGGLLEHAVKISGFFLRKGEVVGVENSRGQLQVLSDRDDRILYAGPMVVHTSRVSASASEILAGALKDYKRAVITGDDHTFGKGTVQTVTPLPPGQGALKITTALFFRPGGKSTQNEGVQADISIPSVLTAQDFGEDTQRFALPSETIQPFLSSYANAIGPQDRWSRVSDEVIAELARRSRERIEGSAEFAEIREQIREARENDGLVKLADILKEQAAARAEEAKTAASGMAPGSPETTVDADAEMSASVTTAQAGSALEAEAASGSEPLSPQLEEALNILADLVAVTRRGA